MFRVTENTAFEYFWYCNPDSFLNSVPLKLHFRHFETFSEEKFFEKMGFCLQWEKVVFHPYAYPPEYF